MTNESAAPNSSPDSKLPTEGWPWGQLIVAAFGLTLCLSGARPFAELISRSAAESLDAVVGIAFISALAISVITIWRTRFGAHKHRPLPRRSWLRAVNIGLWTVWLLLIGLAIAVPAFRAGQQAYQSAERKNSLGDAVPRQPASITTADGRFSIHVPADWHDLSAPVPANVWRIAQANPSEQLGILAAVDSLEDVAVGSLDAFALLRLSQAKEDFDEFDVQETGASIAFGRPTREVLVAGVLDSNRVMILFRFAETSDRYIQLRAWGVPSEFRQHDRLLRMILDSFRESNGSGSSAFPPSGSP